MAQVAETRTYPNGWKVEVCWDEDAGEWCDPRQWDNLGTMVTWHRNYSLGDRQVRSDEYEDLHELLKDLKRDGARCIMPLYLFDHSGLSMSTDDRMFRMADSAGWDWGLVGVIYTTTARVLELGAPNRASKLRDMLRSEVNEYDLYLRGSVFYWRTVDPYGETGESCGGYLTDDPSELFEEAESMLPNTIGHVLAPAGAGL